MNKLAVLSGIILLLSACASDFGVQKLYRGPKVPDSDIAKIHVPGDIDVVRVDEKSIVTLFSGDPTEIQVLPGEHKIVLRYYQIWEVRNDLTKIISDPVAKTLTVQAGRSYQVEHDSPKSVTSAESYARNFDFTIREIGSLASVQTGSSASKTPQNAAVAGAVTTVVAASPNTSDSAGSNPPNRSEKNAAVRPPLDQLKYWWGQASDADRQNFRRWIQSP